MNAPHPTVSPLRQRMLEDMRIRNLSRNTQLSYLQQVSAYARHFARSPDALGPDDVRAYQLPEHLSIDTIGRGSLPGDTFLLSPTSPALQALLQAAGR